jgi:hypothetical protein
MRGCGNVGLRVLPTAEVKYSQVVFELKLYTLILCLRPHYYMILTFCYATYGAWIRHHAPEIGSWHTEDGMLSMECATTRYFHAFR